MNKPNYILKTTAMSRMPKKNANAIHSLKIVVLSLLIIMIIASIMVGDNLFGELQTTTQILLVGIVISVLFQFEREKVPKEIEIQFYDDYLVLYKPHVYYSRHLSRMEYYKMNYKEIQAIQYQKIAKRINLLGVMEVTWHKYNKDGMICTVPERDRKIVDSICYFYEDLNSGVDFVKEFEAHTPLKVEIRED